MQIVVGRTDNGSLPAPMVDCMHALRYRAFRERLQWDVPVTDNRERDRYDECNAVFVLASKAQRVVGCCRLLPTVGPYMLKDTFSDLLHGATAPTAEDIWEISRFAATREDGAGFRFSPIPASMIRELVRYALTHGIRSYVFVTTLGFERLLQHMGIHIERFGAPKRIGIEDSVALWMHNDAQTIRACSGKFPARPAAIESEAVAGTQGKWRTAIRKREN